MDYVILGKRIKERRLELGLTQVALARMVNASPAYIGHIEHGVRRVNLDMLAQLAHAMHFSVDGILGLDLAKADIKTYTPQELEQAKLLLKMALEMGRE